MAAEEKVHQTTTSLQAAQELNTRLQQKLDAANVSASCPCWSLWIPISLLLLLQLNWQRGLQWQS
jgi:hypothetical protein